jgi:glucan phosphoethanolaminetransferase (alkaline phosphatase superfamily)
MEGRVRPRQNARMSLKLFRSTGYSSLLTVGERQGTMHPAWIILACSAWAGFVCNVALWRELAGAAGGGAGIVQSLALGLFVAATCAVALSLLGWRRTIKPACTLVLATSAFAACAIWGESIPIETVLAHKPLASVLFPGWASLLRWQVPLVLVLLAVVPIVWVWNARLRRLPGPRQLTVNLLGAGAGALALAASALLLHGF